MKRQLVSLALICFTIQYVFGQISEGGEPMSFSLNIEAQEIPAMVMPPVDVKALREEDEKAKMEDVQRPFRFGYAIDVDIDIKKDGIKKNCPMGIIYGC